MKSFKLSLDARLQVVRVIRLLVDSLDSRSYSAVLTAELVNLLKLLSGSNSK